MNTRWSRHKRSKAILNTRFFFALAVILACGALRLGSGGASAEKLTGVNSSLVMSQSLPYIAQEAGLLCKHNLEFQLVYISSSGMVTAAMPKLL